MHHVLIKFVGITIYTYSALLAVSALAGLSVAFYDGRRRGLQSSKVGDAALSLLLGGIAGARAEYVLLNLEYFREQPSAALQIWQGGFALHGGLAGGILALALFTASRKRPFWLMADVLARGFSLSAAIGWLACLFGGCAYGRMGFGLLYFEWHDLFGVTASRFAVQPLGAALHLLLFAGLWMLRRRDIVPGLTLAIFLLASGCIHFGLGFARGDESLMFLVWRADQWLSLVQMIAALILITRHTRHARSPKNSDAVGLG